VEFESKRYSSRADREEEAEGTRCSARQIIRKPSAAIRT
jgi:hypothetical protein